jgi:DNA-binding transcriptional MocR family regulator
MIDLVWNFPLLASQGAEWKRYLAQAVEQMDAGDAVGMRPSFRGGDGELRKRAAAWMGVEAERFWFTCGGHHGTLVGLMTAGMAGKAVASEWVTYTGIVEQARMLGCALVGLEFDGQGMLPEALRGACEKDGAKAIFAMPSVHNPLGITAGLERRQAVVEVAREFDLVIVEDDAYGFMEEDAPAAYRELAPERTFYVRGLSKTYAPATRTGLLVAPERWNGRVDTVIKNSSTGTSVVHNAACVAMMEDGVIDRLVLVKRVEGARRNAEARKILGSAAAEGARCAWHLWVTLPEGLEAAEAQKVCGERGVLVSAAGGFTVPGFAAPRALRLALGGEVEAERTLEGVGVVAEVIRG